MTESVPSTSKRPSVKRVCPWCGTRQTVLIGPYGSDWTRRWRAHVDPNLVPKDSLCDGSGRDYAPRQYVPYHDGLFHSRGI
jgi:hypothetical protein